MENLASMSWQDLLTILKRLINVLTNIESINDKKNIKINELASLNRQVYAIKNDDCKVGIVFILVIFFLFLYGLPTFVLLSMYEMKIYKMTNFNIVFYIIPYIIGFIISIFIICMRKYTLVKRKRKLYQTLPNLNRRIEVLNNEIASFQMEIDRLYSINSDILNTVPLEYYNKADIIAIYNILHSERAYNWKDAVKEYVSDSNQQKMLRQQQQFQQEQLRKQDTIIRERQKLREDIARYNEQQIELERHRIEVESAHASDILDAVRKLDR